MTFTFIDLRFFVLVLFPLRTIAVGILLLALLDAANVLAAVRARVHKVGARAAEHDVATRPQRDALVLGAARHAPSPMLVHSQRRRRQRREPHKVARGRADGGHVGAAPS